ncbi:MAG TPA: lasso peptide biosynthesis B2 protein [Gemmatimonadaceae bacterium]|nr:lasso peptide biosynthesis B2 protein [Gemmatimonadaceae bacterium]
MAIRTIDRPSVPGEPAVGAKAPLMRSGATRGAGAGWSATPQREAVEGFLLGRAGAEPPPTAALRSLGLAAYAYASLAPGDTTRESLRADYLAALARHQEVKRHLVPLLGAWRAAGVDALLFKGFHLAELVYPAPGARYYGDVDVLVRPEQVGAARRAARELGWSEHWNSEEAGLPYSHGALTLFLPDGPACIDVHRWAVQSHLPWNAVQRRITGAVWAASREREWEGTRVREMAPADAALVALVLNRCWGERWSLQPHDALDLRQMAARWGTTREDLLARARELRCERTLKAFLERCDPWAGRLKLATPSPADVRRWDWAALLERGPLAAEKAIRRMIRAPQALVGAVSLLPLALRVTRAMRDQRDVRRVLETITPAEGVVAVPRESVSLRQRLRAELGARWALWLLRRDPDADSQARALTLYAALRRQGWPAVFVSGFRTRGRTAVEGHAWVELDGLAVGDTDPVEMRRLYRVGFTYPAVERDTTGEHTAKT